MIAETLERPPADVVQGFRDLLAFDSITCAISDCLGSVAPAHRGEAGAAAAGARRAANRELSLSSPASSLPTGAASLRKRSLAKFAEPSSPASAAALPSLAAAPILSPDRKSVV